MLLNGYGSTFKKQNRRGWFILRIVNIPIFAHWHDPCPFPQNITIATSKKIKKNPTQFNSGKLKPRFWILGFLSLNPKIPGVAQWYPHDIATSTSGLDRRTWGAPRVVAVLADHDHLQWGSILFFARQLMQLWMWSYTVYIIYTTIMHIYIYTYAYHICIYIYI